MSANESTTLYQSIADGIEEMIRQGTLRPGDRIPSVRQLSRQHRVSPPTVLQAYTVLENRRLIEARPRSGFYVRQSTTSAKTFSAPNVSSSAQSLAGFPPLMAMVADITNPRFVPMGGANPSAELLPTKKLSRIIGAISREQPGASLNYDPVPGCPRLRHELSRRSLDWGCYLQPDDFLVTGGATEALHLALAAVCSPGDTVIVEAPTYYGLLNILSYLRLKVIAIPAQPDTGIDLNAVEKALARKKVSAVVVLPNFSNPLGALMPEAHRTRLLALAAQHKVPVIEDDIYGDLHHEGARPRCLKALDKTDSVILCGSFSKTLAPGYRVGFVAAGRHQDRIAQAKNAWTFGSAPLPAMAVAEFLRNGGYDHHLRSLRTIFRDQVARMRAAVLAEFPKGVHVSDPKGGFVLWVELSPRVDALALFHRAREANISIAPGHLFSPTAEFSHFIRLSCGYPWTVHTEAAIRTLGGIAAELGKFR